MRGNILIDTNVLVYAYDASEPLKQPRAYSVLDQLIGSGRGVVSTQILSEFFVAVTRKIQQPLSAAEAYGSVNNYLQLFAVVDTTGLIVLEAARGARDHGFPFWDAMVWATARLNQIPAILSEDFNSGSTVEGVHFVNPFSAEFRMEDWLSD